MYQRPNACIAYTQGKAIKRLLEVPPCNEPGEVGLGHIVAGDLVAGCVDEAVFAEKRDSGVGMPKHRHASLAL